MDGLFGYMHATRLTRWHLLRFLPAMVRGTLPTHHKLVRLGRAARVTGGGRTAPLRASTRTASSFACPKTKYRNSPWMCCRSG